MDSSEVYYDLLEWDLLDCDFSDVLRWMRWESVDEVSEAV